MAEWRAVRGRELVTFHATDAAGFPVYHTNVMMAVGTDVAVVCLESVADPQERQHLLASLRRHHEASLRIFKPYTLERRSPWHGTCFLPRVGATS